MHLSEDYCSEASIRKINKKFFNDHRLLEYFEMILQEPVNKTESKRFYTQRKKNEECAFQNYGN